MRTLSLYRHAKSSWKDLDLDDIERPINKRGRNAAAAMGAYMASHNLCPDLILLSPSLRTRQTFDLTIPHLPLHPQHCVEETLYLADSDEILDTVRKSDDSFKHIAVISHNPGLHHLAHKLAQRTREKRMKKLIGKFPTAALAVFEFPTIDRWIDITHAPASFTVFMKPKALPASSTPFLID